MLEKSLGDCHKFEPAWNGSLDKKVGIFGGGTAVGTIPCMQEAGRKRGHEASFGGARSADLGSSTQGKVGAVSYDSLL